MLPSPASAGPQITGLEFSDSVDGDGQAGQVATRFDSGTKAVYGVFDYAGFQNGATFNFAWQHDGEPPSATTSTWQDGAQGSYWVNVSNDAGLADGTYTLTLGLNGQVLQTGNMSVGPPVTPAPSAQFGPPLFAEGISGSHEPVRPHAAGQPFAQGTTTVYAFMSYSSVPAATLVAFSWSLAGQVMASRTPAWDASYGPSGVYNLSLSSATGLPTGQWRLDVQIDGAEATHGEFAVGSAAGTSAPLPAPDGGVQVIGAVNDADTGRPIPAASVWALQPGTDVSAFQNHPDASMLYASGTADHKGFYSLSQPLQRGSAYTLIYLAKGYQGEIQRDVLIDQGITSTLEIDVQLHQD